MGWLTVKQAIAQTGVSRATWWRRVKDGHPSKQDERGRRLVLVDAGSQAADDKTRTALSEVLDILGNLDRRQREHGQRVAELVERVKGLDAAIRASVDKLELARATQKRTTPTTPRPAPLRVPVSVGAPDYDGLLARADASGLSDAELGKAAGLNRSWLCKARHGEFRSTRPSSLRKWRKLEAELDGQVEQSNAA